MGLHRLVAIHTQNMPGLARSGSPDRQNALRANKLLHSAFSFFVREENEGMCSCDISDNEDGSTVSFRLRDGNTELISMSFYAPDHSQAELISEKIKANPMGAYKNILEYLLNNQAEKIDVEKYL